MIERIISKKELNDWLEELKKSFKVYGPVDQGEQSHFALLTEGVDPDFSIQNTRLSPKSLVEPQSERMFEFTLNPEDPEAHILKEKAEEEEQRLLVGIRPCDAQAYDLVRLNFVTPEYQDPWWKKGRESLLLIGQGCADPCSACFCTSVGGGPFNTAGLDLLLTDLGESYLVRTCTDRGEELLKKGPGKPASDKELEAAAAIKKKAEESISTKVPTDRLKDQDLMELYNAPFWDQVQFSCINCGTCTYLCPTCWCFDIQDEVKGSEGVRLRNWDSCMFPLFTLHGSGHNPRGEKLQRVRQRFMHKLKYYVDKYSNGVACVGCGRCVQFCPVNIDIRRVCQQMNDYKA
ncbi:MAG: 4Fe-4S dicluster domain-containing protein [Deltaproteobacteria bacterium]|nr:4Fe-4S dicluster domain-containing protein [Deltaproteobacteria bacterium]